MYTRNEEDTDATEGSAPQEAATLTREMLAASLSGLSDDALDVLAVRTHFELHQRVGEQLTRQLSEAQLSEFEVVTAHADTNDVARWLDVNVPGHHCTVATCRAQLVAEVTEAVSSTDPEAARGTRTIAEVVALSAALIEHHVRARGLDYRRLGDAVVVAMAASESCPALDVTIAVHQGRALLVITGTAPLTTASNGAGQDFVQTWNASNLLPSAVVTAQSALVGVVTTQLPTRVTRQHADQLMDRTIDHLSTMFVSARSAGLL